MKVLASGIDTLKLTMNVIWKEPELFKVLEQMKEKAIEANSDQPGVLKGITKDDNWIFGLKPYGSRGYEWILTGKEINIRIGNWPIPRTMPSVIIEIGSEALWRYGPLNICEKVLALIENNGGTILDTKTSRADLCVDLLIDKDTWDFKLVDFLSTRANKWSPIFSYHGMETLQIGLKGIIIARLYDKALEIKQRSKKFWMYNKWWIKEVKENERIIRVEFELKRDALKELRVGELGKFFKQCDEVWAYCTKSWLKFLDNPGKHHTQRNTLEFWKKVQNGFMGVQDASPAIREKAINEDAAQLKNQIVGFASSLTALKLEEYGFEYDEKINFQDILSSVMDYYQAEGNKIEDFTELVKKKRARYSRTLNQ